MLDPLDLGWLIGLIEGEGSFGSTFTGQKTYIRFQLSMVDLDVMQKFQRLLAELGIETKLRRRTRQKTNWTDTHVVSIVGIKAKKLALLMEPHMGERRKIQIQKALAKDEGEKGGTPMLIHQLVLRTS